MRTSKVKRAATFLCACVLATAMVTSSFGAAAAGTGTSSLSTTSQNVTPGKITVKVQDADVRDVFSAIAVNMGYNIIYVADPKTVTIEMKDLKPDAAFEYLLKALDMQYIAEGNTLIVGERSQLMSNFRTHLALCTFKLTYMSATVLATQIQKLDLPVTIIQVPSNDKMLWVQGFSVDIAKINDLIYLLDIPANASTTSSGSSATGGKSLTYVTVGGGMTAYEFNRLLKTLGLDCGLCLADDGSRLYLYATSDELSAVNSLLSQVAADGNYAALSNSNKTEILTVTNISKKAAIEAISQACPDLQTFTVDNSSRAFLVMGSNDLIQQAKELLAKLDVSTMNTVKNTVNSYQLQNITAAEAVRRLESVSFDDTVEFYNSDYSEFSKTVYVYCSEYYWPQVQALIAKVDVADLNMSGTPVYVGTAADATNLMNALVAVRGIAASKLQTYTYGSSTILYLSGADASDVAAVDEFISRLNSVSGTAGTVDVSWAAYQAYCTAKGQTPTSDGYVAWVASLLGTASTSGSLPAASTTYSAPQATATPTPTPAATVSPADKLNQAQTALNTLFGSYAATSATTPEDVLAAAQQAVAAAGLTDVSVAVNPDRTVSYVVPTAEAGGSIGLPLSLTCSTSFLLYQAQVTLPAATPAA